MASPRAWFVICLPPESPDGPGEVFGPFDTRERAEADTSEDTTIPCDKQHLIVYGPGTDRARLSGSTAAIDAYHWYYDHPEQIPASCAHIFPRLQRVAD